MLHKENALHLGEPLTSIVSLAILHTLWCHFFQSVFIMDKSSQFVSC